MVKRHAAVADAGPVVDDLPALSRGQEAGDTSDFPLDLTEADHGYIGSKRASLRQSNFSVGQKP